MNIFSRYLMRNLFLGFTAASALLIPLFSTFDFINELDDVSSGGYRWSQALLVVLMKLPRCFIDLGPFIALLGGIVGLGQMSKSLELTAMRVAGLSIVRIALITLYSGIFFTLALSALDEWVASPLQQKAVQFKDSAMASGDNTINSRNVLWARHGNEFVTVKTLDDANQPAGIEIFSYRPDFTLKTYIYADKATVLSDGQWLLQGVNQKQWENGKETTDSPPHLLWKSLFTHASLEELMMPSDSFSIRQLNNYIAYLQSTGQPDQEFKLALWQKPGRSLLMLAMILLAVPFTFSTPRSPGLGSRLAVGVIVGLLTYVCYQIVVNLGLLFSFNAQIAALGPPLLLFLIAGLLINRFDKKN